VTANFTQKIETHKDLSREEVLTTYAETWVQELAKATIGHIGSHVDLTSEGRGQQAKIPKRLSQSARCRLKARVDRPSRPLER
jgi:hypothetical protein